MFTYLRYLFGKKTPAVPTGVPPAKRVYDFTVKGIDGTSIPLAAYRGKVLMMVNVASQCGNTPQYAALETLYERYRDKGFEILAFPSNDFGGQEPGSDAEILKFCTVNYRVQFPLFGKIAVKGADQHPLYRYLTTESTVPGTVRWNFQKYLVDREGNVVDRFAPTTQPDAVEVITRLEALIASSDEQARPDEASGA